MACVRSVLYTVPLNGQACGYIVPERDIRQGEKKKRFIGMSYVSRSQMEDLGDFKQALLVGRTSMVNDPCSLLSKLNKGRYFASKELLDCGRVSPFFRLAKHHTWEGSLESRPAEISWGSCED